MADAMAKKYNTAKSDILDDVSYYVWVFFLIAFYWLIILICTNY